jgi:hypothetical protein
MILTNEQKLKAFQARRQIARFMLQGTLNHCRRLLDKGMVEEAIEIMILFTNKSEREVKIMLMDN